MSKILCIEDERFISELYARALTKAGYEVVTVLDGKEGLEKALHENYDVVLLDIMLPSVNGVVVLETLKKGNAQTSAKVIITTNLDQKEDIRQKVEQMADGYIIKAEVTPNELVQYVNEVVGS